MKLQGHHLSKLPNDNVRLDATWRTRMRESANVEVSAYKVDAGVPIPPLFQGEATACRDLFFGFAEIAWEMGWRPRGLENVLAGVVKSYKIPKE